MSLYCIIQSRSGSTRFPQKAMADMGGKSVIQRVYESCRGIIENTIVAIPANDDALSAHLSGLYIPHYLGAEHDVLKRYVDCARTYKASKVIRITGDCPVLDVAQLMMIATLCQSHGIDFGSNAFPKERTSIDGNDVEYMTVKALAWLDKNANSKSDREHVTQYFYNHQDQAKSDGIVSANFKSAINLSHIKTSIDTPEDIERVKGMLTNG